MGWQRWHLTMPWFEMIRIPTGYVGGTLCWRGTVMWESENERFTRWPGEGCRAIEAADAGQRVFGIAIVPDTLAMRIDPPWTIWARQLLVGALAFAGLAGLVITLCAFRGRRPSCRWPLLAFRPSSSRSTMRASSAAFGRLTAAMTGFSMTVSAAPSCKS
jgi:hypothetical protein